MKCFLLLLVLLALPVFVAAQGPDRDWELTVHSGWSSLDIDRQARNCIVCEEPLIITILPFVTNVSTGDSVTFGFKTGYYITDYAEVEGSFSVAPNHDLRINNIFECPPGLICPLFPFFERRQNMVAYQYDASFVYNILKEDVRPFVSFGVGGVTTDLDQGTKTDFAFQVGAGAKFYFKNLGLRFEVNDHIIPDHFLSEETEHNIQVVYGFLFRLG